jgi:hypothetical protein
VEIEVALPVFWAWHDHSAASRRAHGAAYATYVGCWKSKVRVAKGDALLTRFEDKDAARIRTFCSRCGTPVMYERSHSPKMVTSPARSSPDARAANRSTTSPSKSFRNGPISAKA